MCFRVQTVSALIRHWALRFLSGGSYFVFRHLSEKQNGFDPLRALRLESRRGRDGR